MQKIRRNIKKIYCFLFNKKQKSVIAVEHGARLGNFLYFFLHAYISRTNGINLYYLQTPNMEVWLKQFPFLTDFTISEDDFKWYDNLNWRISYQQFLGVDFSVNKLNSFIENKIIQNNDIKPNFGTVQKSIINIRRGDFYKNNKSSPSTFNQIEYVEKSISSFPEFLALPIEIISDDVEWCEKNLSSIFDKLRISVDYKYDYGPIEDFRALCSAKNLIITNSTFSYWGGYVCAFLSSQNVVIAPNFGSTWYSDSIAIQIHPDWNIIDVLSNEK